MKFDITKPVETWDGLRVRIIDDKYNNRYDQNFHYVGAVKGRDNGEQLYTFNALGRCHGEPAVNLRNVTAPPVPAPEPTPPAVDLTKPVQTLDGRPARILCTDRKHPIDCEAPVFGLVMNSSGEENAYSWRADGTSLLYPEKRSLVNVPVKQTRWINIYTSPGKVCSTFATRQEADKLAKDIGHWERIACLEVEFTEGQGLTDSK